MKTKPNLPSTSKCHGGVVISENYKCFKCNECLEQYICKQIKKDTQSSNMTKIKLVALLSQTIHIINVFKH